MYVLVDTPAFYIAYVCTCICKFVCASVYLYRVEGVDADAAFQSTNSRRAEKQVRSKVDFLKVAYVHAYMGGLGFGFRARDIWWTDICLCMSGFTCGCIHFLCRPNLSVFEVCGSLHMPWTKQ